MVDKTLPTGTEHPPVATERQTQANSFSSQPGGQKGKGWVWIIVLLVIGALGYFMYYQYRTMQQTEQTRQNARPRTVPVNVSKVQKSDMNVYVEALGTVTPVYTVTITSRVQGQITDIHYREGQPVHKGDPLIDIDARPYQAAVTQMEGQLAKDQAVLAEARIDLDRYQTAYSRNAIAKQQLDDQTQLVQQDQGTVQNDQGQLENARVNLAYTHIISPIDGRVGLRLVDMGNIVQANSNTALVVVTQLQPITVIFSVDQGYLPQIQQQLRGGRTMTVYALDKTQQTKIATGKLITIDNQVDPTTETVKLRASFDNSDGALFPNEFVNARLLLNTLKDSTVVPSNAIQRNSQGPFVYVIDQDQTAKATQVSTGVTDNNLTVVTGLTAGTTIATNGFDKLQDGAKVSLAGQGRGGRNANASANNNSANGDAAP